MNNTPTPETDAVMAGDMGDSTHLIDMENLCRKLEQERDKWKAAHDKLEKVAVSLWGVVKERDQLRKVADGLAHDLEMELDPAFKPYSLSAYDSLPHVIERKTK